MSGSFRAPESRRRSSPATAPARCVLVLLLVLGTALPQCSIAEGTSVHPGQGPGTSTAPGGTHAAAPRRIASSQQWRNADGSRGWGGVQRVGRGQQFKSGSVEDRGAPSPQVESLAHVRRVLQQQPVNPEDLALVSSLYWWPQQAYSFLEGADLCAAYGGSLVSLASANTAEQALALGDVTPQVEYWIGLVNSAGVPGREGTWTWVDQEPYVPAAAQWGSSEPSSNNDSQCAYVRLADAATGQWAWHAGSCNATRGVLCGLPRNGVKDTAQPFGCMRSTSLELQRPYARVTLQTPDASQQPQLCAARCRQDAACDAFQLAGAVCGLHARNAQGPPVPVSNASMSVGCYKYGLDFVDMGRLTAIAALAGAIAPSDYKCVPDYRVNLELNTTLQGVCAVTSCADACSQAGLSACTAFVHSTSRCRCQLGTLPLYGSSLSTGPFSGGGYMSCMRGDADWLRLGALADPSLVSIALGTRVFTLHPEPLPFDAAATVCRTQPPEGGTLASVSSLLQGLLLARRLLLDQPPRQLAPQLGMEPGLYGAWVGLVKNGTNLSALLAGEVGASTQDVTWDDGSPLNRTLLQTLWAVDEGGEWVRTPQVTTDRVCVYFSNDTTLVRPGLAAADSCAFALPFICQSSLGPPSPVTPPPAPRDNVVAVALAYSPPPALPDTTLSGFPGNVVIPPGVPRVFSAPETGALMWVQPGGEAPASQAEAQAMCALWNATLVTLYNASVQTAVTAALPPGTSRVWVNLGVRDGVEWGWAPPVSAVDSAAYMAGYTAWCSGVPPAPGGVGVCGQLAYNPTSCSAPGAGGWGWQPADCTDTAPYVCAAQPEGTPGRFYCAEGYDFSGVVVSATLFNATGPGEAAGYCADLCTASGGCHAFSVAQSTSQGGSVCVLKGRNATSHAWDVVKPWVAVSCFKHALLWDVLGGQVAVALGVGADASTRFRCIQNQDVARTDLSVAALASCSLSDCAAQCFATRMCRVVVFDNATCTCSLGWRVLLGLDGATTYRRNVTTCMYDDAPGFAGLGLVRAAAYIAPPEAASVAQTPPLAWLFGSRGASAIVDVDSGDVNDINFIPASRLVTVPSATNPFNPADSTLPPGETPPVPGDEDGPPPAPGALPSPPAGGGGGGGGGNGLAPDERESSGGSGFGVPAMVGITVGFCSAAVLFVVLMGVYLARRRRRREAAKAAAAGSKHEPTEDDILASLRGLGVTPDLERVLLTYLEGLSHASTGQRDSTGSGSSGSPLDHSPGSQAVVVLTTGLARELEEVLKKEEACAEPDRSLPPATLQLLRLFHYTVQYSPGAGSTPVDPRSTPVGGAATGAAGVVSAAAVALAAGHGYGLDGAGPSGAVGSAAASESLQGQGLPATLGAVGTGALAAGHVARTLAPGQQQQGTTLQGDGLLSGGGDAAGVVIGPGTGTLPGPALQGAAQGPGAAAAAAGAAGGVIAGAGKAGAAWEGADTGTQPAQTGYEMSSALTSKSGISSSYITLTRLLGAGSFGTVYEGLWRRQTVAVKIIPHSPTAAMRVKNEVELAMQFDHPNVVRSYFYETFDTRALQGVETTTAARDSQETWIVLEYCSQGSLASRLYAQQAAAAAEGVIPVPKPMHERDPCIASMAGILHIAYGVAQGMAHMHSLSICHGDLKCENVLLAGPDSLRLGRQRAAEDGAGVLAKVADFGLSRAIGDVSSHLSTATVGTVTHMPPELLLSGQLRASCDVYSFGVLLWQLYTAAIPYAGMRYAEIVYKVAVCGMRPAFPGDTPRHYRELAELCWHNDAACRPTFEQVVDRLGQLLSHASDLEEERKSGLRPTTSSALSDGRSSASSDTVAGPAGAAGGLVHEPSVTMAVPLGLPGAGVGMVGAVSAVPAQPPRMPWETSADPVSGGPQGQGDSAGDGEHVPQSLQPALSGLTGMDGGAAAAVVVMAAMAMGSAARLHAQSSVGSRTRSGSARLPSARSVGATSRSSTPREGPASTGDLLGPHGRHLSVSPGRRQLSTPAAQATLVITEADAGSGSDVAPSHASTPDPGRTPGGARAGVGAPLAAQQPSVRQVSLGPPAAHMAHVVHTSPPPALPVWGHPSPFGSHRVDPALFSPPRAATPGGGSVGAGTPLFLSPRPRAVLDTGAMHASPGRVDSPRNSAYIRAAGGDSVGGARDTGDVDYGDTVPLPEPSVAQPQHAQHAPHPFSTPRGAHGSLGIGHSPLGSPVGGLGMGGLTRVDSGGGALPSARSTSLPHAASVLARAQQFAPNSTGSAASAVPIPPLPPRPSATQASPLASPSPGRSPAGNPAPLTGAAGAAAAGILSVGAKVPQPVGTSQQPALVSQPSGRARSKPVMLPGGPEAHITMRAHSNSHAVLGMHALQSLGISPPGAGVGASPGLAQRASVTVALGAGLGIDSGGQGGSGGATSALPHTTCTFPSVQAVGAMGPVVRGASDVDQQGSDQAQ